ncbi:Ger(x)C family spore germination protein [Heliobacterium undosum]|uniref:Ger(X)C family spore germination protein n=1 Tax=Heliomicrobium undosum TaxID=121734 RepID=A0A845L3P9_9FIRM|nr:Ger(x)C family spore germination protein [Heliomicrobium undosum]MZP29645.1 Ger(x)C family spore germination protein [Heliomicrobium undosum]
MSPGVRAGLLFACFVLILPVAGCWNYREIRDLGIVVGAAFDKEGEQIHLTVELMSTKTGEKAEGGGSLGIRPQLFESSGKTVFEAVRNMIAKSGKKLYWSHAKAFIVSEEMARDGMIQITDWINRDAEVRSQTWVLVTRGERAADIFKTKSKLFDTVSMQLEETLRRYGNSGKLLSTTVGDFVEDMEAPGIGATIPFVQTAENAGDKVPQIGGTALFRGERLVGYLDAEETRSLLFIRDRMNRGSLIAVSTERPKTEVSLEIYRSKTKRALHVEGNRPVIELTVEPLADIAEISTEKDVIDLEKKEELTEKANKQLARELQKTIREVQEKYQTDVFGFGQMIHHRRPDLWEAIEQTGWERVFPDLEVQTIVDFRLKGSALLSEPTKVGE